MFFFITFTSLCLTSCGEASRYEGTFNSEKNESLTNFVQITDLVELFNLKNDQKDFILYVYSSLCLSCETTSAYIEKYVSQNHYLIYGVDVSLEETKLNGRNSLFEYFETPTIGVFDDGQVVSRVCWSLFPQHFDTEKGFFDYLDFYLKS